MGYTLLILIGLQVSLLEAVTDVPDAYDLSEDDNFAHRPDWVSNDVILNEAEELMYFYEDHDYNEDFFLDSMELFKAMYHTTVDKAERAKEEGRPPPPPSAFKTRRFEDLVDRALAFDINDNGYFEWDEFKMVAKELKLIKAQ